MKYGLLAGVLGVCLGAIPGAFSAAGVTVDPAAPPALVARLVATSGTTNAVAARDLVLKAGPAALPALRAVLRQTNGVPFETLCLVRALAAELGGVKRGAVARGTADDPAAGGLTDGDIVFLEDEKGILSHGDMDLSRTLNETDFDPEHCSHGATNESWRLVVRKPEGTDANVTVTFGREVAPRKVCPRCGQTIVTLERKFPLRFLTFPDSVHAYWTRGALGPWDTLAVEALWKGDLGQYARTRELMEEAFVRGCRDPLAFAVWLEALSSSGGFETIPFICESYEKLLASTADREALVLGRIAFVKSRSQFLVGQTEAALRITDESVAKARRGGVTNSLALLAGWRMTLGVISDPVAYLEYARAHAAELRQYIDPRTRDGGMVVRRVVHRYMAVGRPDMAREVVGFLDPQATRAIRSEVDAQQKLAERHSNELARTYWVPMKAALASHTQEAPPGHYRIYSVPNVSLRGPFRLDWTMHLPKILPSAHRNWAATTRAIIDGEKHEISVGLDHDGRLRVSLDFGDDLFHATVGSPKQRHRFSLQVMPHAMRVDVDGQPQIVRYFDEVVDPMVAVNDVLAKEFAGFGDVLDDTKKRIEPRFQTVGCAGTIEDVVAYVPSATKVDTDAMTKTLIAMEQAIARNNPVVVTQAWQSLQAAFRPVADGNPLYKDVEKRMTALTATGEQPWTSLREAAGGSFKIYSGEWKRDGEWLTAVVSNFASGASIFADVKIDSGELAGVIDIPPEATNASCYVHWNSIWKKDDNAFQVTPGAGTFNFGVWQDARLFLKNRPMERTGRSIPFCIRSRGTDAALFIGKGDKPVALASGLKNQGDAIMINFRNMGAIPCRIGNLRIRTIAVTKAMGAPAEMPEAAEVKKEK